LKSFAGLLLQIFFLYSTTSSFRADRLRGRYLVRTWRLPRAV